MICATTNPLRRATALLAVLGVLALITFAASPALHAWLHEHGGAEAAAHDHAAGIGHEHGHDAPVDSSGHVCAITLFAQGALSLLLLVLVLLGGACIGCATFEARDHVAAPHPWYRLVPSHAPPAV